MKINIYCLILAAEIEKAVSIQKAGEDAAEEWLELPNGCLCCTIKTTALQAIESLLIRKQGQIDYILLETTGLADPYPIINSFWADEALECRAYLDGVVCLVDAKNIEKLSEEFEVLMQQIVLADVLMVNKIDLVDEKGLETLKNKLKLINPLAKVLESKYGKVCDASNFDFTKILDMKAYGKIDCTFADHKKGYLELMASLNLNENETNTGIHHSGVRSIRICTTCSIDKDKFERWLFEALWSENNKILRAKGLIRMRNKNDILVQAVQDLYELTEVANSKDNPINRESVLIMLGVFGAEDEKKLKESFHASVY